MGLDTDLDLMKEVGGPDGDSDDLDPSKWLMMYELHFHMIQAYERGGRYSLW